MRFEVPEGCAFPSDLRIFIAPEAGDIPPPAPALRPVDAVLQVLRSEPVRAWRVSDIALRAGLEPKNARGMLSSLVRQGRVTCTPLGGRRFGYRVILEGA